MIELKDYIVFFSLLTAAVTQMASGCFCFLTAVRGRCGDVTDCCRMVAEEEGPVRDRKRPWNGKAADRRSTISHDGWARNCTVINAAEADRQHLAVMLRFWGRGGGCSSQRVCGCNELLIRVFDGLIAKKHRVYPSEGPCCCLFVPSDMMTLRRREGVGTPTDRTTWGSNSVIR